jgi:hypothetical protein
MTFEKMFVIALAILGIAFVLNLLVDRYADDKPAS